MSNYIKTVQEIIDSIPDLNPAEYPPFTPDQVAQIIQGYEDDLHLYQILTYADPAYEPDQMERIEWAYTQSLPDTSILYILDPELSPDQMQVIIDAFLEDLPEEQISLISDHEIGYMEMEAYKECMHLGFSYSQMHDMIDPRHDIYQIQELRHEIEAEYARGNLPPDYDQPYPSPNPAPKELDMDM